MRELELERTPAQFDGSKNFRCSGARPWLGVQTDMKSSAARLQLSTNVSASHGALKCVRAHCRDERSPLADRRRSYRCPSVEEIRAISSSRGAFEELTGPSKTSQGETKRLKARVGISRELAHGVRLNDVNRTAAGDANDSGERRSPHSRRQWIKRGAFDCTQLLVRFMFVVQGLCRVRNRKRWHT